MFLTKFYKNERNLIKQKGAYSMIEFQSIDKKSKNLFRKSKTFKLNKKTDPNKRNDGWRGEGGESSYASSAARRPCAMFRE